MSDQRQWWKLWHTALSDQVLENLDLESWARWARFNAWVNVHGEAGKIAVSEPGKALWSVLRVGSWEAVTCIVTTMPGLRVKSDGKDPVTLYVEVKRWYYFQGDRSAERMRKLRAKGDGSDVVTPIRTGQKCDDVRREEKRGEEKRGEKRELSVGFSDLWKAYPPPKGPKQDALKAFKEVRPPENVVALLQTQVEHKLACDARGDFWPQLPHLYRWLKKRRWEDEILSIGGDGREGQPAVDPKSYWKNQTVYLEAKAAGRISPRERVAEWEVPTNPS